MLDQESKLTKNNRYTYSHLLIPHFPYILSPECNYLDDDGASSPKDQSLCGIKIMRDLIDKLKSLGRFEDSLIIFQSDHGARFSIEENALVNLQKKGFGHFSLEFSHARSRPLLLIKPSGIGAEMKLKVSDQPAELTDIAATLLTSVNLQKPPGMMGVNLFDQQVTTQDKIRNYYFYTKLRPLEWTDKMTQFQIHGDVIMKIGVINLTNNEKTKLSEL
jgi:hypothetical protein